jgi:AhpD family alkylhydroperoxidase
MERESGLSKAEREMVVVATSAANDCLYCVVAHGAILRVRARDSEIADRIAANWRTAPVTERQHAMLAFAVKLARTPEGHFMEAHVKLRPVDMATEGLFICGTAHSPQLLSESISQAYAAASRAITFLSKSRLTLSAVTAKVTADLCAACLICVRSCPYNGPKINAEGVSEIDEALCHGCGICAAECPAKAIQLNWYEDDQLLCKVDALLADVI